MKAVADCILVSNQEIEKIRDADDADDADVIAWAADVPAKRNFDEDSDDDEPSAPATKRDNIVTIYEKGALYTVNLTWMTSVIAAIANKMKPTLLEELRLQHQVEQART